jgi:hypothetical protein
MPGVRSKIHLVLEVQGWQVALLLLHLLALLALLLTLHFPFLALLMFITSLVQWKVGRAEFKQKIYLFFLYSKRYSK